VQAGTVINVLVGVGNTIAVDQAVLELETDKATVEIPSTVSGVVTAIHLKAGDTARVGQPVLTVETSQPSQPASTPAEPPETPSSFTPALRAGASVPQLSALPQPTPISAPPEPPDTSSSFSPSFTTPQIHLEPGDETTLPSGLVATLEFKVETDPLRSAVPAAPNVRRLAREIGVDITLVPGTGPQGRISMADVKNFARRRGPSALVSAPTAAPIIAAPLPDFSKWGEVKREPMSNIRRKTAEHLAQAWATIPHVTQFAKADIGEVEELRQRFSKNVEAAGAKLTITAILLKVVTSALKAFPRFNASVDMTKNEVVYKQYYHIGVAVDTEHGLLVPVIRDVDKKNILELAVELQQVAEKARNRKLGLDDMQGGNFTITNLGGIGGSYFTPIVNAPEVAILGVARGMMEPIYNQKSDQFEPRLMLPLALSYDHRLIDGADGARFLKAVVEHLEQPFLTALQGW
jgi:pyruvate dehydrogenase E2 component (dihydrolipoamide acetyltransferase)